MINPMAMPIATRPARIKTGKRMIRSGSGREDKAVFAWVVWRALYAAAYDCCESALHA